MRIAAALVVLWGSLTSFAQVALEPQGNCRLETSPVPIGGSTTTTVTGLPFAPFLAAFDSAPGYFIIGGLGTVHLGLTPNLVIPLDGFSSGFPSFGANGQIVFSLPVANVPALDGAIAYGQIIAYDPTRPNLLSLSNGKSIQFTYPDTHHATGNSLTLPRAFHQTARLPNGAHLVIGGGNGALLLPVASTSCERYDPYLRTFTQDQPMSVERTLHRATTLNDGRILVTGGCITFGAGLSTAEIYDPATNTWSAPIPMTQTRIAHTATKLPDGRVLLTGGSSSFILTPPTSTNYLPIFQSAISTAEIFDPATNTFSPTANTMSAARFGHAAIVLPNGNVLISGGVRAGQTSFGGLGIPLYALTCDLFNPTTNTFTQIAGHVIPRVVHSLNLLPNGQVMAIGGAGGTLVVSLASTEFFNPSTNTWTSGPALPPFPGFPTGTTSLGLHTTTNLPNGDLYIAGGAAGAVGLFQGVTVALTYNSTSGFTVRSALPSPRQAHTADWTPEGLLLIGGADAGNPNANPAVGAQAVGTAVYWTPY